MEGARVNGVCEVTVNEEFSNKLYNSFNSSPARSAGQTDAGSSPLSAAQTSKAMIMNTIL